MFGRSTTSSVCRGNPCLATTGELAAVVLAVAAAIVATLLVVVAAVEAAARLRRRRRGSRSHCSLMMARL